MIADPVLIDDWHAVARSSEVKLDDRKPALLLGQDLVLWRNRDGLHAWQDLCIHRGAKLSGGQVRQDCLVCPYHFWEYDPTGRCVRIPSQPNLAPQFAVSYAAALFLIACYWYGMRAGFQEAL